MKVFFLSFLLTFAVFAQEPAYQFSYKVHYPKDEKPTAGCGTAIGIEEHIILTCRHLIRTRIDDVIILHTNLKITFNNKEIECFIFYIDEKHDIAFLKTNEPIPSFIEFEEKDLGKNCPIHFIGNGDCRWRAEKGHVIKSNKDDGLTFAKLPNFQAGDSGAPAISVNKKLAGMFTCGYSSGVANEGLFAPASMLKKALLKAKNGK